MIPDVANFSPAAQSSAHFILGLPTIRYSKSISSPAQERNLHSSGKQPSGENLHWIQNPVMILPKCVCISHSRRVLLKKHQIVSQDLYDSFKVETADRTIMCNFNRNPHQSLCF
ncbi:hypothetical protein AVEN_168875-1 [Araneus ventricosus]|uniref:Uncharacterized protein n=1 Tax=Araneus ventricosus TaxID=182803 RepID=A0A4Y2LZ88_ARAVE|nr:hypothetical protein AVEN_168875-1 [Araneus ventricosus]